MKTITMTKGSYTVSHAPVLSDKGTETGHFASKRVLEGDQTQLDDGEADRLAGLGVAEFAKGEPLRAESGKTSR